MTKIVAYLGREGSYSFIAAKKMINGQKYLGRNSFTDIISDIKKNKVDVGVLPIENSTTGSIYEVYDLLLNKDIEIVGEGILKINHLLLAKKTTEERIIKRCYCQIEAWKQCKLALFKRKITPVFAEDTALAVQNVSKDKNLDTSAIGNTYLAQKYKLKVITDSIQIQKENFTRFVALALHPPGGLALHLKNTKVTMIFSVLHKPGSLLRALTPYAKYGLNLTKIELRPILHKPWEYIFIVDFIVKNIDDLNKVVKEMIKTTRYLKILGVYQKGTVYEA
ncbi:hypothetical protein HYW54_03765 [Candidatus Gottesmanbacteria bacterium]|nr:hypothetical protein [Candidatus Gottesmanbacteria bacterium]